ncbi:MAG TPA: hypothetical protein VF250_16170 [Conexibacter sp.]
MPLYYEGGERINRFRGIDGATGPEDWVGSVSAVRPAILPAGADPTTGISRLEDGTNLRDAIAADATGWLGPDLAAEFGDEPGLLVKLLDAGGRLPVHCHPSRALAREKLGSRFGKTEGWVIMEAEPDAAIWLGFNRDVEPAELRGWVDRQDVDAMFAAMHRMEARAGDVFYVPAGVPHSIGAGIMLAELQEPTSFSICAEYEAYGLNEAQATLKLGWDDALPCFDLRAYSGERLQLLRPRPEAMPVAGDAELWRLFPAEADPFFQAFRARVTGSSDLGEARFRILVIASGEGSLATDSATVPLHAGETWLVPHGAGRLRADGDVELLICDPPQVARVGQTGLATLPSP